MQERLWTETTADDRATEEDAQQGGCIPTKIKPQTLPRHTNSISKISGKGWTTNRQCNNQHCRFMDAHKMQVLMGEKLSLDPKVVHGHTVVWGLGCNKILESNGV